MRWLSCETTSTQKRGGSESTLQTILLQGVLHVIDPLARVNHTLFTPSLATPNAHSRENCEQIQHTLAQPEACDTQLRVQLACDPANTLSARGYKYLAAAGSSGLCLIHQLYTKTFQPRHNN